jgi:hypothetical protein
MPLIASGRSGLSAQIFKLLRVIRLAKLLRLLRNNLLIENMETKVAIDYSAVQLSKYLMMLIFLTHWLGCGWCVCACLHDTSQARTQSKHVPPRAAASLYSALTPIKGPN